MTPKQWRNSQGFSLADMADLFGLKGKNPAVTYRRYELGLSRCPLAIVIEMERFSQGAVTPSDWLALLQPQTAPREAA